MPPSPYVVFKNKPIDQWKVTELKDELKKRKLPVRGLKDELVRRLDEALREEMNPQVENEKEVEEEELVETPPIHSNDPEVEEAPPVQLEEEEVKEAPPVKREEVKEASLVQQEEVKEVPPVQQEEVEVKEASPADQNQMEMVEEASVLLSKENTKSGPKEMFEIPIDAPEANMAENSDVKMEEKENTETEKEELKTDGVGVEPICASDPLDAIPQKDLKGAEEVEVKEASPADQNQMEMVEQASVLFNKENTKSGSEEMFEIPIDAPEANEAENSDVKMEEKENTETEKEELKTEEAGVEPIYASDPLDAIPQKDLKGAEEVTPGQVKPNKQVSQVGPDTGSQVKCESIYSNESFKCNNVGNELKDNLNADNFDLKKQVEVKQDIQDDKNKKTVKNQTETSSLEGENYENTHNNNIDSIAGADSGSPEKLNLDRSSGDDSMEEDLTDSSKPPVESVGGEDQDMVKEVNSENMVAVTDKMDSTATVEEVKPAVVAPSEKRKLEAQEVAPNSSENFKRQRRWNSESVKVPDLPNLSSSSTPKDPAPPVPPKRTLNRSDSNISTGSPKERIVPPPQKPATNSLRIDRFVRPFTLKAVQELLGTTGSVSSFWMDHIKTHCYVTYSSVEEAIATRNAVYNLQWPPNGGNQLIAEFVEPQEVKQCLEATPQSPAVVAPPTISTATTPKPSSAGQPVAQQPAFSRQNSTPRDQQQQVQLPPPPPLPAAGSGNAKPVRERLPPPPPLKKTDPQPAVVTLDDLFRKTKTVPRIYYLPLSEETVAAKLAARAKAAKE